MRYAQFIEPGVLCGSTLKRYNSEVAGGRVSEPWRVRVWGEIKSLMALGCRMVKFGQVLARKPTTRPTYSAYFGLSTLYIGFHARS